MNTEEYIMNEKGPITAMGQLGGSLELLFLTFGIWLLMALDTLLSLLGAFFDFSSW
jgi:hypothetical protein